MYVQASRLKTAAPFFLKHGSQLPRHQRDNPLLSYDREGIWRYTRACVLQRFSAS